jgi:hypothetical protein
MRSAKLVKHATKKTIFSDGIKKTCSVEVEGDKVEE